MKLLLIICFISFLISQVFADGKRLIKRGGGAAEASKNCKDEIKETKYSFMYRGKTYIYTLFHIVNTCAGPKGCLRRDNIEFRNVPWIVPSSRFHNGRKRGISRNCIRKVKKWARIRYQCKYFYDVVYMKVNLCKKSYNTKRRPARG